MVCKMFFCSEFHDVLEKLELRKRRRRRTRSRWRLRRLRSKPPNRTREIKITRPRDQRVVRLYGRKLVIVCKAHFTLTKQPQKQMQTQRNVTSSWSSNFAYNFEASFVTRISFFYDMEWLQLDSSFWYSCFKSYGFMYLSHNFYDHKEANTNLCRDFCKKNKNKNGERRTFSRSF